MQRANMAWGKEASLPKPWYMLSAVPTRRQLAKLLFFGKQIGRGPSVTPGGQFMTNLRPLRTSSVAGSGDWPLC